MKNIAFGVTLLVLSGCGGGSGGDGTDGGSGSGRNNTASACYNASLYLVGTRVQEIRSVTSNGVTQPNNVTTTEVIKKLTYQGVSDVLEITSTGSDATTTYVVANDGKPSITTLGSNDGTEEVVYQPSGIALDFDLAAGQTRSYPTVTEITGGAESATYDYSMTYVKNETITVQSKTFDTCQMVLKIKYVETATGVVSNAVFTQNIGVGNGITIREKVESSSSNGSSFISIDELVVANINGKRVE
ncbi:hypothetical protein [Enterovibrio nigricans]|uniref:Lipoprotein n=1 Tax=Enterovibrio nigricans DSM 22720 TaxID=1121868 RepID=A0A1T4UUJ4_9GAMM|nr:hypothetical protein [Enterovibrio nigricans]PKF50960.1 hypothetical protein AT251_07610 [Enterovibrio nigricans]SKA56091.1 hypothetical protein SAMN02745132_02514 [Enterovibrio nigricans DSM 22720]